jgi:hypothetical protein
MPFESCDLCDELIWDKERASHHCKMFTYRLESDGDPEDWSTWYGRDAEDVAAKIVEHRWSDYPYDPSRVREVVIFRDERGCEARFAVTAEATVDFSAREVTE